MNSVSVQLFLYCASFFAVWWGAGLVINSLLKLSQGLRLSAFVLSFFVLGILTSLPEMAIGFTSIVEDDPQIFIGNMIGGIIVIFLFVIPLLGLVGRGLKVPTQLSRTVLITILVVTFLPTLFIRDRVIERWEAVLAICSYISLFLIFSRERSLAEKVTHRLKKQSRVKSIDVIKILAGVSVLWLGSNQIVDSTLYFADYLKIAPFFVSLVVVSLGTNIPEITLVFRSLLQKKQDVALADFVGSAATNVLLFGVLSLIYGKPIDIPNHYYHRLFFIVAGLVLTFIFMRSRNALSKVECTILLLLYIAFIITELIIL